MSKSVDLVELGSDVVLHETRDSFTFIFERDKQYWYVPKCWAELQGVPGSRSYHIESWFINKEGKLHWGVGHD